jgi:hypothetical protein
MFAMPLFDDGIMVRQSPAGRADKGRFNAVWRSGMMRRLDTGAYDVKRHSGRYSPVARGLLG